jgi:plasmid stability protein
MAHLTVPDLPESLIQALQVRADRHHRSLEDEVRTILEQAVAPDASQYGFGSRIHQRFAAIGGWALELPERPIKTLHPPL